MTRKKQRNAAKRRYQRPQIIRHGALDKLVVLARSEIQP